MDIRETLAKRMYEYEESLYALPDELTPWAEVDQDDQINYLNHADAVLSKPTLELLKPLYASS